MRKILPLTLAVLFAAACEEVPTDPEGLPPVSVDLVAIDSEGVVHGPVQSTFVGPEPQFSVMAGAIGSGDAVLPAALATMQGSSNNAFPHSERNMRYQQVFLGSEIGGPRTFRELCLRTDDERARPALVQQITLKLGPTNLNPTNIGTGFDANYSTPPTTVFSGNLNMPATGPGGLNDWKACVQFATPFNYAGGNLIVEMINSSPSTPTRWSADFCGPGQAGCNTTRLWAHNASATTAQFVFRDQGLVMRLSTGVIPVDIDIKPGSNANSINCNSENATIAIAILTTDDFDATTVDHTTVTFEGATETHVDRKSGVARRHEEDADGDGDTDLVLHFRLGDTGLTCDSVEGTLEGETFDGQAITGTDAVRMIDRGGGQLR
jgi:hypothetical protein